MEKKTMFSLVLLFFSMSVWSTEAVKLPMVEIECAITPIDRSKIHPSGNDETYQYTNSPTFQSTSPTMSGYVAATDYPAASAKGSVTDVTGSWRVPTLKPTTGDTYCAIWLGMDGIQNTSVERIGTAHNWVNGAQQNYAWFEIFPNGVFELTSFPLDDGDLISADVSFTVNAFRLTINNLTQGVSTTLPPMPSSASRSCATWVVQATQGQNLSDFQTVTFKHCSAVIDGVKGHIGDKQWKNDAMTMETNHGKVRAQPSDLFHSGSAFQVSWESH